MQAIELLRYHPNRFATSRDFFQTLYNRYRNMKLRDGILSIDDLGQLFTKYVEAFWNPHLLETPLSERPSNTKRMDEEFALFCHVARFTNLGRNIFHFSGSLVELLQLTDVEDVQWGSIKFPYPCFYLYFGPQSEWGLGDPDHVVDGAYLGEVPFSEVRKLDVLLTTRPHGEVDATSSNYILKEDRYYYFPFEVASPDVTVGATFRHTVGTDDDFNEDWVPHQVSLEAQRMARQAGVDLRSRPAGETAQGQKIRERLEWLPVFRQALKLVVNCLCYLSSPSREVADRYPRSELTRRVTEAPTPLERARARIRAIREGYTLIHFCGDSLEHETPSMPSGRELSAHWRRGHWRNQAIGQGRSEHKLIWIRPTLVRKDKAPEGIPGHKYDVSG
ncbi:MAG TPA: hypothetical protein VMX16_17440 [Terriglobia bacterium]|nr:hypothetical protein [Terriglobia bacterium]